MPNIGSIPTGVPTLIDSAVAAPAAGNTFSFEPDPGGNDFNAVFQATGTLTTLVASLQASLDGGTTWTDYVASANFWPTPAGSCVRVAMVAGALYRINYTTASGSINSRCSSN